MEKIRTFVAALDGWRRYAVAGLFGCILTLTMAPVGFFPAALVSVSGFIWLAQSATSRKQSFLIGWAFGSGYFITGLYWISVALFVDIALWWWVLPLSLLVGPALLALFTYALVPLLAHRFRGNTWLYPLIFCLIWAAIEWLRGHLFTGFPWNLPGYMWQHVLPMMQTAAVTGIYGLTLLSLIWAALPVFWPHRKIRFCVILLFCLCLSGGSLRLITAGDSVAKASPVIRIVQANLTQNVKWDEQQQWHNLRLHIDLSQRDKPAAAVIWPETSVPADLVRQPEIADMIAAGLPTDSVGILGSLRVTDGEGANLNFHNGLYVINDKAAVIGHFDKFHLVPFGEYMPFRKWLNLTPIALAVSNIGDFTPGPGNRTLDLGVKLPATSPLICYEVIFPSAVVDKNDRPGWLVNVTNDAWYGRSSGPYQHLETARMRAVEEGLPLARAANTGISAMIDSYGRITAQLDLGTAGALDAQLPLALPPTIYARFGDLIFFLMLALGIATFAYNRIQSHT